MDDPCLTVTGSLAQRNKSIAIVILFWRSLGFPVAVQEGTKRSNGEVDRVCTPIDRHRIGDKHQAIDLV